jgi:hypothetical protein
MQPPADPAHQLMVLKAATKTTGIVHEAQIFQLRMWGRLCLQHVEPPTVQVLPLDREVIYRSPATLKGKVAKKTIDARLTALNDSVKWLLGDDWSLLVEVAGNAIFPASTNDAPRPRTSKR